MGDCNMKKRLNIILANAPVNNGNKGCVALTYSCMVLIEEILKLYNYDFDLYLSNSYYNDNKRHKVIINKKPIEFEDFTLLPTSFKTFFKSILRIKSTIQSFRIFLKSDYILDIGQGDSFADIYGKERFFFIDNIHRLARIFKKPYCFLPQTIGPFENTSLKKKAVESLAKADLVIARDQQSFDFVKTLLPNQKNVIENIDVAFFLPYERKEFDNSKIHVGLNVSSLLWNGGYSKKNQFGLQIDYQLLVKKIINMFLINGNVVLHLVPHVIVGYHHIENDYEVSYNLWKEFSNKNLVLAPFFMSPCDAKGYISGLDFFMGARMHSTIAAISSGVPVIPMAYSRKFNGLFLDTLKYNHVADLRNSQINTLVSFINQAFLNRNEIKDEIKRMGSFISDKKKILIDSLSKFMRMK